MSTISTINHAKTTGALEGIIDQEAELRGITLDISLSFSENAEALRQKATQPSNPDNWSLCEMAELLDAAEKRWFELDG
jgi:hypothetical protein